MAKVTKKKTASLSKKSAVTKKSTKKPKPQAASSVKPKKLVTKKGVAAKKAVSAKNNVSKKTVSAKGKPAKKISKAKPVKKVKPVKKAASKKEKKLPLPKTKTPAKKAAKKIPASTLPKTPIKKKTPIKGIEKSITKKKEVAPKLETPVKKSSPPQLKNFPIVNHRPIAHPQTKEPSNNKDKTRYTDEELKEFEWIIVSKLDKAKEEFKILKDTLTRTNDEGTDSTSGGNTKVLEDGAETAEKENLSQLAARQLKYITNLENALVRIKNGTYGICSVTGKLIAKERLMAVPHTTQSIEAKMMQKD